LKDQQLGASRSFDGRSKYLTRSGGRASTRYRPTMTSLWVSLVRSWRVELGSVYAEPPSAAKEPLSAGIETLQSWNVCADRRAVDGGILWFFRRSFSWRRICLRMDQCDREPLRSNLLRKLDSSESHFAIVSPCVVHFLGDLFGVN